MFFDSCHSGTIGDLQWNFKYDNNSDFIIKLVQMINHPIITTSVNVHKSNSLNNVKEISQNFNSINIFSNSLEINSKGSTIIDCTHSPFKVLRQGDGVI